MQHPAELAAEILGFDGESASLRQALASRLGQLAGAEDQAAAEFFTVLADSPAPANPAVATLLQHAIMQRGRQHDKQSPKANPLSDALRALVVQLYAHWKATAAEGPTEVAELRESLLSLLTHSRTPDDLRQFAELVVADPPQTLLGVGLGFTPLMQHRDFRLDDLFPRLLDALTEPSVSTAILDLANHAVRERGAEPHPAEPKKELLMSLLGAVSQRLGVLEDRLNQPQESAEESLRQVSDGVSLAVGLCDALALIGDPAAIGKLYQAMERGHRRLQTEAAAALARLGEEEGKKRLVTLAAEPIARLRVLAYAAELDLSEEIEPEYASEQAKAESELALALAEPTLFGAAPTSFEKIDQRSMYWPGFEEPVDCWLFRFHYDWGSATYSNIGIAGPLAHAVAPDVSDLPVDDIYALYAGWQAQHEDIYELEPARMQDRREVDRFQHALESQGYEQVQPQIFGVFFEEKALVATAVKNETPGVVVIDQQDDIYWRPGVSGARSPGPNEIYCLYKGRRLLRSFNK